MTNQNETKEARRLSDEEIICAWMEPNRYHMRADDLYWHRARYRNGALEYCHRSLTLDALWEIEERLILLGYRDHIDNQISQEVWRIASCASTWHATPEQKIRALAFILRPIVESR